MATYSQRTRSKSCVNVEELLSKWKDICDAETLVCSLCKELKALENFLEDYDNSEKSIVSLVRIFSLALQARNKKEELKRCLKTLCESRFLTHHLPVFTSFIQDKLDPRQCQAIIVDIADILKTTMKLLPNFALKVTIAASHLKFQLMKMPDGKKFSDLLTNISQEALSELGQREPADRRDHLIASKDSDQPPEKFTDLSAVPTASDLLETSQVFVRRNIVKGHYENVEHYLDVQFRLLRLDFIMPFQKGLREVRSQKDRKKQKLSDIRLYHDVRITETVVSKGYNHSIQFDSSKLSHVDWEKTDRLMQGSLVCLSKDGFKTVILATVVGKEEIKVKNGFIDIKVLDGMEHMLASSLKDIFVMAESTVYYQPYYLVLEGLKTKLSDFPLQSVIIHCNTQLKPPSYLLPTGGPLKAQEYDLSPLMNENMNTTVPVLTTAKWPSAELMCLNESQREAAMLALTKEVSIIQGPPGTGKTYVGLKVVETLLKNKINGILVVCYTNHALDQFLEGIIDFCKGKLTRIGGGCKSDKVTPFIMKKLFLNSDSHSLRKQQSVINKLHENLNSLKTHVQSAENFKYFLLDKHFQSFSETKPLTEWLMAPSGNPNEELPKTIKQQKIALILQWKFSPGNKIKLDKEMNILDRCALYYKQLKKIRTEIKVEMEFAKRERKFDECSNLQKLLSQSHSDILPDDVIDKFLHSGFSIKVKEINSIKSSRIPTNEIVKFWLLGQHRKLKGQLMELQVLSNCLQKAKHGQHAGNPHAKKTRQGFSYRDFQESSYDSLISYSSANSDILSAIFEADQLGIDTHECDVGNERWQHVRSKLSFAQVCRKLASSKPMTEKDEADINDIWSLEVDKRYSLYKLWVNKCQEHWKARLLKTIEEYRENIKTENDSQNKQTASLLKHSKVIGMTTTGAAKYKDILEELGCQIVIVEEAAEVLESHVITAMSKKCKHLILIGDHQQLKPKPATYDLERNFGLNVSLFERLILNDIQHVTLKIQHRMRPEISQIIRLIYPDLEDHPSVCHFEHVRGVSNDAFFVEHDHQENITEDSFSKSNSHEASFVAALYEYLLNQEYSPSQITILATYKGQVTLINKFLNEESKRVRVSAVDDFQGEENDIILLSLVRSNERNVAGFVAIDNRICVALSRAKKGFYVIGNYKLLAAKSELWKRIVKTAEINKMIGGGLPVRCSRHPERSQLIFNPDDFAKRPDGGCGFPCGFPLSCGHTCAMKCHGFDLLHMKYQCTKPCIKSCTEGHLCQNLCYQDCKCEFVVVKKFQPCDHEIKVKCFNSKNVLLCPVLVSKQLACGHDNLIPCKESLKNIQCSSPCFQKLPCGHQCSGICGYCKDQGKHSECKIPVSHTFQYCGHTRKISCFQSKQPCTEPCKTKLLCGHQCSGSCSECLRGAVHQTCKYPCSLLLPCGHPCKGHCSTPCLPCKKPCPYKCRHHSCITKNNVTFCGEPCTLCTRKCMQKCKHLTNLKRCSDTWSETPCSEPCTKSMNNYYSGKKGHEGNVCTHSCKGICGEKCICPICQNVQFAQFCSSEEDFPILNSQPANAQQHVHSASSLLLKLPSCGHIFNVSDLDNHVKKSCQLHTTGYINCPACNQPILDCMRYDKINHMRFLKREKEKLAILERNTINNDKMNKIKRSFDILKNEKIFQSFETILKAENTEMSDFTDFLSISLKLKFIFSVCKMNFKLKNALSTSHRDKQQKTQQGTQSESTTYHQPHDQEDRTTNGVKDQQLCQGELHESQQAGVHFNDHSDLTENIVKLLHIVMTTRRFTPQLESELWTETLRTVRLKALRSLENMASVEELKLFNTTEVLAGVKQIPANPEFEKKAHDTIVSICDHFTTLTQLKLSSEFIKNTYLEIVKVLTSKTEEVLVDILYPEKIDKKSSKPLSCQNSHPRNLRSAERSRRLSLRTDDRSVSTENPDSIKGQAKQHANRSAKVLFPLCRDLKSDSVKSLTHLGLRSSYIMRSSERLVQRSENTRSLEGHAQKTGDARSPDRNGLRRANKVSSSKSKVQRSDNPRSQERHAHKSDKGTHSVED